MTKRLIVPKTYKLYVGGAFPRSESGRTYEVVSPTWGLRAANTTTLRPNETFTLTAR